MLRYILNRPSSCGNCKKSYSLNDKEEISVVTFEKYNPLGVVMKFKTGFRLFLCPECAELLTLHTEGLRIEKIQKG